MDDLDRRFLVTRIVERFDDPAPMAAGQRIGTLRASFDDLGGALARCETSWPPNDPGVEEWQEIQDQETGYHSVRTSSSLRWFPSLDVMERLERYVQSRPEPVPVRRSPGPGEARP